MTKIHKRNFKIIIIVLNAYSVAIWCGYLQNHEQKLEQRRRKMDESHIQVMC
jgi:hypothetical protein